MDKGMLRLPKKEECSEPKEKKWVLGGLAASMVLFIGICSLGAWALLMAGQEEGAGEQKLTFEDNLSIRIDSGLATAQTMQGTGRVLPSKFNRSITQWGEESALPNYAVSKVTGEKWPRGMIPSRFGDTWVPEFTVQRDEE
jgi:hypothetical protein